MTMFSKKIKMPAQAGQAGTLISAKSYFSDRFTPSTEYILLPEFNTPSGELSYHLRTDAELKRSNLGRRRLIKNLLVSSEAYRLEPNEVIVDFTLHSPANWAHTLDFYIPLFLFLRNQLAGYDSSKKLRALLPEAVPGYIKKVFDVFGLSYIATDKTVIGDVLECQVKPFDCLRAYAKQWLEEFLFSEACFIDSILNIHPSHKQQKLFISRRGGRSLSNERQVENILVDAGFVKVYAEDMSPEDQIRSFVHCETIVAVHGAAIAPLLYRQETNNPLKLIEIFNPGHMTNFYRGMAGQVNCEWIGVRGKIKPKWVKPSYDFNKKFTQFSLSNFSVDPESLKEALANMSVKSRKTVIQTNRAG